MALALGVILGWMFWSLGHYTTHRLWHRWMLRGVTNAAVEGERQHHETFDGNSQEFSNVPASHISFRLHFPIVAGSLASIPVYFVAGFSSAITMMLSFVFFVLIDDRAHRLAHGLPLKFCNSCGLWIRELHRRHHDEHDKNFAILSGIIWDISFGTFRR